MLQLLAVHSYSRETLLPNQTLGAQFAYANSALIRPWPPWEEVTDCLIYWGRSTLLPSAATVVGSY